MTDRTPLDLDAIRARADKAHEEISGLCNGSRRWTMRIPVTEADSDMVLSDLVMDVDQLVAEVTTLRAELDAARAAIKTLKDQLLPDGA